MYIERCSSRWPFIFLSITALCFLPAVSLAKKRDVIGPRRLDRRVEAILRRGGARRGFWGLEVVRASDAKIIYARASGHFFQPASNMKLFTTAAAIEKLGPDFVFRTTVESDARPDPEGRVANLRLVGRGDPNLSSRLLPYRLKTEIGQPADAALQNLADQLAAQGIHEVSGNLVVDDSYFLFEPYSPDWAVEDLLWGYGAPVTALAFNDDALVLHIRPGAAAGEVAQACTEPAPDYYKLNSRVKTVESGPKHIFVERAPGSMGLDIWGQIPLGTGDNESEGTLAIADPPQLAGEVFRRALERRSITVRGQVEVCHLTHTDLADRDKDLPPSPPPRVALAVHASLQLREDVMVINKVSQNLHAEMLLRTLAAELKRHGSIEGGLEVLQDFCSQAGIQSDEIHLADGSGLSRKALVTPHAVVKLLQYMSGSPRFEAFFDSLPLAGVDGTLSERFKNSLAAGRIHAKTGTMEHVNALSGYMDLASGERLAFSIIANSHNLDSKMAEEVIDGVALAIFEWYARRKHL